MSLRVRSVGVAGRTVRSSVAATLAVSARRGTARDQVAHQRVELVHRSHSLSCEIGASFLEQSEQRRVVLRSDLVGITLESSNAGCGRGVDHVVLAAAAT